MCLHLRWGSFYRSDGTAIYYRLIGNLIDATVFLALVSIFSGPCNIAVMRESKELVGEKGSSIAMLKIRRDTNVSIRSYLVSKYFRTIAIHMEVYLLPTVACN